VAGRGRDEREPANATASPVICCPVGPLAQHHRGEEHREQRLRLHDERRESHGHAVRDAEELEQELPCIEREPGGHEHRPAHGRARQDEGRSGGDQEAKRHELEAARSCRGRSAWR